MLNEKKERMHQNSLFLEGVVGVVKKAYTGMDATEIDKFNQRLTNMKTSADKNKLLKDIHKSVTSAENMLHDTQGKHALKGGYLRQGMAMSQNHRNDVRGHIRKLNNLLTKARAKKV